MSVVRVFVSFDVDHDRDLRDRLLEQARARSTFQVANRSESGEIDPAWLERARGRIAQASEVIVICGEHSDASPRMCAELEITRELRKPYLLLWGRRDRACRKPKGARPDDGMYNWTLEILEHQLSALQRRNDSLDLPDQPTRRPPLPKP